MQTMKTVVLIVVIDSYHHHNLLNHVLLNVTGYPVQGSTVKLPWRHIIGYWDR